MWVWVNLHGVWKIEEHERVETHGNLTRNDDLNSHATSQCAVMKKQCVRWMNPFGFQFSKCFWTEIKKWFCFYFHLSNPCVRFLKRKRKAISSVLSDSTTTWKLIINKLITTPKCFGNNWKWVRWKSLGLRAQIYCSTQIHLFHKS